MGTEKKEGKKTFKAGSSRNVTKKPKAKEIQMHQQDQMDIQKLLANNAMKRKIKEELDVILRKHNARLVVDLNSAIGNPVIQVILN